MEPVPTTPAREEETRQVLHAARIVDLHHLPMQGPVEMQHLAAVVAGIMQGTAAEQPQTSLTISLPAPAVHKMPRQHVSN
jgi:hypothetical protein